MRSSASGAMPQPLSDTTLTTSPSSTRTCRRMSPPLSVYFAALDSRFCSSCTRRASSPTSSTASSGTSSVRWCWRASISGRAASALRSATSRKLMRSRLSPIFPVTMRPTSSRSSTSRVSWLSWRSMMSRQLRRRGDCSGSICMMLTALRIGASGLRSSCDSIARNSLVRRLEFSSSTRRRRSLMSRIKCAKPRSAPPASNTGMTAALAQNMLPSLRRRQPSSSTRRWLSASASSRCGLPAATS